MFCFSFAVRTSLNSILYGRKYFNFTPAVLTFIESVKKDILSLIVSHTPAGSSVRNAVHYAQEINNRKFLLFVFFSYTF